MTNSLYSYASFACAAIIILILVRAHHTMSRQNIHEMSFLSLERFLVGFTVIDGIWGVWASGVINSGAIVLGLTSLLLLAAALAPHFWLNYVFSYAGEKIKNTRIYGVAMTILTGVASLLLLVNLFTGFLFSWNSPGISAAATLWIIFLVIFLEFAIVAAIIAVLFIREKRSVTKFRYAAVLIFACIPLFACIFQCLVLGAPIFSIFLTISCIEVYSFVVSKIFEERSIAETERRSVQYQNALINAATGYFEVNLSKDKIIGDIYIDSDGKKVSFRPEGLEEGFSYSAFAGWWADNRLLSDPEDFKEQCSPAHLIELFGSGNVSVRVDSTLATDDGSVCVNRHTFSMSEERDTGDILALCLISNITNDVMAQQKAEAQERIYRRNLEQYYNIIDGLASDYQNVYEVNLSDDSMVAYKRGELVTKMLGDGPVPAEFTPAIERYIQKGVARRDRDNVRLFFSIPYIRENLKGVNSFTRIYLNNLNQYTELKIIRVRGNDDDIILGFGVKDAEIRKQQDEIINRQRSYEIIETLSESFEYVGYIDTIKNEIKRFYINAEMFTVIDKYKQLSSSERLDCFFREIIPENDIDNFIEQTNLEKAMIVLEREGSMSVEFNAVIAEQKHYYILRMVADKGIDSGIIFGILCVDEEMEKQIELQDALKNAEIANAAKSSFLTSISHDIRTPLNAIKGYALMAKKYSVDPLRLDDCLGKIDIAGSQLVSLLNLALDMSIIESGKMELRNEKNNIVEVAHSIMTIAGAVASTRGHDLKLDIKNIKNEVVMMDEARFNQIATNILGNAIKYTPAGGKITFTLEQRPHTKKGYGLYAFIVKDNGIGMSKEFLNHIYDEFSREKTTTASGIEGAGLGMTIVKNIVDLMEGTIDIKSRRGTGTTVTVLIPMKFYEAKKAEELTDDSDAVTPSLEGRKLLLVEDNEMNREIARDILEEYGLIIEEAEDGDIAVQKCQDAIDRGEPTYYEYVLMDIQMPRMDGYKATRAIRELYYQSGIHLPIIAMTANAFEEDKKQAIAAGMDAHLAKPVNVGELIQTLEHFAK